MNAITKFLILAFWMFSQLSSTFAQTKEVDAIKAVISKETSSYFNVDYKGWADTWQKVSYAYWSYSDSTNTSFVEGWDALNNSKVSYFKNSKPSRATITNEWQEVRIYGNGAYVRFIQRVKDDIDRDETSQMRVLEKTKEGWKVICVAAIARYPKE
ncbi:MAG: hypothetical protein ACK47E_06965 [Cyclobacteriaceae bacterium]